MFAAPTRRRWDARGPKWAAPRGFDARAADDDAFAEDVSYDPPPPLWDTGDIDWLRATLRRIRDAEAAWRRTHRSPRPASPRRSRAGKPLRARRRAVARARRRCAPAGDAPATTLDLLSRVGATSRRPRPRRGRGGPRDARVPPPPVSLGTS